MERTAGNLGWICISLVERKISLLHIALYDIAHLDAFVSLYILCMRLVLVSSSCYGDHIWDMAECEGNLIAVHVIMSFVKHADKASRV